jgi:DedD protein
MAFFKFRWPGQSEQADKPGKRSRSAQAESIEVMRRRARHRLIGAAILVGIGVVGFPVLFDTQPRPIAVDIPIEIPDRATAPPLSAAASRDVSANRSASPAAQPSPVARPDGLSDGEEAVATADRRPQPATTPAPQVAVVPKPEPDRLPAPAAPTPVEPKAPRTDEAARAQALLNGATSSSPSSASSDERFIVQVGAFAENDKAREARMKVERAGLKTYTQVVETKDGKRIRVRVGPFASRAEAEKAAARIKAQDLPAAILTL